MPELLKAYQELQTEQAHNKTALVARKAWSIFEKYIGYLVLLIIFFVQGHQARIKSRALLTLYYTERTESSIALMESAQRGFLVTGDPDMYQDFVRGQGTYISWSQSLRQALQNDPENLQRLNHMRSILQQKIEEMNKTMVLAQSGHLDQAQELVKTRIGQRYMADARDTIRDIRASEEIHAISAMSVNWSL